MKKQKRELNNNGFLVEIEKLLTEKIGSPAGTLALVDILNVHGGQRVYIPRTTDIFKGYRDEQIKNEFTGDNHNELALKWGVDPTYIYNTLRSKE